MNRKPDIDVQGDGRVILRGNAYRKMKVKLRTLANGRCEKCGAYVMQGDVEHINGRGGGRRDDRIFVKGVRNLLYLCRPCHHWRHTDAKPCPAKPTEQEFDDILGI
jgi:hypothetical protein